ncbi:NAD(P)-binding protein [Bauldia litoralis]|uniref:NADPH-dependent glutamate synthase beta chain n=1 Tax=Bauldia litoralis TaxID=665467 RepID=A0A1G6D5U3_9HYPH|nr:NAD(P)-binding protein [Bauldia litoralis]SDB40527.1 NADPH-dependent glutamate synthase beta chain [Bauldia litoralis]
MSLIPKDLTPVLQATMQKGAGARRWQRPAWIDHLPPCNSACPAGENIQAWLAHARTGDFEAAWRTLVADNPMPAVHGRACYHPCETSCNRKDLDEAVLIHAVERHLGDLAAEQGWTVAPGPDTGKRILVVGAGPAGLSCAWHLRRLGHAVEIRDAMAEPGGMLHYGIPAYRLPRADLAKEVARIAAMGVTFTMNTRVDDLDAAVAEGGFDACFVAIGAQAGNHLDIPAADGRKMVDAIRLFEQVEAGNAPLLGRVVGIVGGGNTAMDAARVARRLGAEEAILIYRRDREHMRADPYEADEAFLEGVKAQWLTSPVRFGAEGVTVEAIELGEDGALTPTGRLETLPVDALVLALGQHAELDVLRKIDDVAIGARDTVLVDAMMMTGRPGLFAGGDVIGGLMTMTAATGHGKKAARAIDAWLNGQTIEPREKAPSVDFPMLNLPHFLDAGRSQMSALPPEARSGFAEVVAGIDARQARYESDRCLSCGNCFECDNCFAACPEQAVVKLGKGRKYTVDLDLCTGCAVCYDQCPCHAIEMLPEPVAALAPEAHSPLRFKVRP